MEPVIQQFAEKFGDVKWINSHVAKSIVTITWKNGDVWFVNDLKTEGHHYTNYIGKYVITGGNWREREDKTPLDVLKRQLHEELGESTANIMLSSEPKPFADYLEFKSFSYHGDKGMREVLPGTGGDVYCIVSVFGITLDGEQLQKEFGIPSENSNPHELQKRILSNECGISVLTLDDLKSDSLNNFVSVDSEKLRDYLMQYFDIGIPIVTKSGGKNYKLESDPLISFEKRDTTQYLRVNPLKVDTRNPESVFKPLQS